MLLIQLSFHHEIDRINECVVNASCFHLQSSIYAHEFMSRAIRVSQLHIKNLWHSKHQQQQHVENKNKLNCSSIDIFTASFRGVMNFRCYAESSRQSSAFVINILYLKIRRKLSWWRRVEMDFFPFPVNDHSSSSFAISKFPPVPECFTQ